MRTVSRRSLVHGSGTLAAALALSSPAVARDATPAATPSVPVDSFQVLFIRHAESEINVRPTDVPDDGVTYPLTALGVRQAQALALALGNVELSAIHTSTRLRCVQTSDALAFNTGLTLNLMPGIVETGFGPEIVPEEVAELFRRWLSGEDDASAEGGEDLNDMRDRFLPAVTETITRAADDPRTLVFVAHGAILGLMLPELFTNLSPGFGIANILTNTGIVRGTIVNGELVCTDWNGIAPG